MKAKYVDYAELPYAVYGDTDKPHETIVFLHGKGEAGTDLKKLEVHSLPREAVLSQNDFTINGKPVVIIAPQLPTGGGWAWRAGKIMDILDSLPNKIGLPHLTGVSLGGIGVMDIMAEHHDKFASFGSVCGWLPRPEIVKDVNAISNLKAINWHGDKDNTVGITVNYNRLGEMSAKIGRLAMRMYIFVGDGHAIWGKVYGGGQNSMYFKWLHEDHNASNGEAFERGYQKCKNDILNVLDIVQEQINNLSSNK